MDYRDKIQFYRSQYLHGEIDLDTAKKLVEPLLVVMNEYGKEIAKKYGRKYKPLTFGYVMR